MGIIAKANKEGSYEPVSAGMHLATCIAVYDLGTQFSEYYNKAARKVLLMWEIPEERIEIEQDGKRLDLPRVLSKIYTNSLHTKASLRGDLESWRGRAFTDDELAGFDLTKLIGCVCFINVIHEKRDTKTYANIRSITPPMKGVPARRETESPVKKFSFDDGDEIPEDTPEWISDIIKRSDEWRGVDAPEQAPQYPDQDAIAGMDDVPF